MKSSAPPLPPSEQTGLLLDEFETGTVGHKISAALVPLLAVFSFGLWIYLIVKWGPTLNGGFICVTLMLLSLTGLLVYGSIWAIAAFGWRLRLYENGLLFCEGSSSRWIPWKDIAKYREIQVIMNGVSTGYRFYIHPRQGRRIPFDGFFKDTAASAARMKEWMIPGMIRDREDRLDRGEGVDFQFLTLQPDGLKTSKDFVAWKDLESVSVEGSQNMNFNVVVRVSGRKRPWLTVPAVNFPCLDVFFSLVQRYRPPELASKSAADFQPGE